MTLHPEVELNIKLDKLVQDPESNRNALRKAVIREFMKERAGKGTGEDASKYRYIVESAESNARVYLTRPVPLNKGFDFIIHVENFVFMNGRDNPRHDDITHDLLLKKEKDPVLYGELFKDIEKVFYCQDPEVIIGKRGNNFKSLPGMPADLILKIIKWLFVEQDIRYWNWSGRAMFMKGIKELNNL